MPINWKAIRSTTDNPKNTNLILLSAQPKFLNFKAIKGSSAINNILKTNDKAHKK